MRTAPMTMSASSTWRRTASVEESSCLIRFCQRQKIIRSLSRSVSRMVTSAPMPRAMFAAFWPATPPPSTTTLALDDAADPAHEHPAAALGLHQRVGADLGGQAAGHLGHRVEQRQHAGRQLHRLVGDGRRAGREQRLGLGPVGGQVQVGEQDQVLAQPVVLLRHWLLDLEDHLRLAPHLVGGVEHDGALLDVVRVGDGGPEAGSLLDQHLVTVLDQLVHPDGGDGHPELVVLDLAGDADLHASCPPCAAEWRTGGRAGQRWPW